MSDSKPVSRETIANLVANSGLVIDDLYKALKSELAVRSLMDVHTPVLYVLTQDLQNSIKFILMDMGASCKAEFSVNNLYEKRFHMKNIQASISEGYKLLYNFGKLRKKSLWKKLMKQVHEDGNSDLITEGLDIERKLEVFGNTEIDQKLRNLTLHYDNEMIEVYKSTVLVDSEEETMTKVRSFWGILQEVKLYTDKIDEYCLSKTGIDKPFPSSPIMLGINDFHKTVCQLINKDGKLENVFDNLPKEAVESIDLIAEQWNGTKRVEAYIRNNVPSIGIIPEIGHVQVLENIQLLLRFMMLDMVAIVDAYLKSSSDIEYALNLRRVCVTKVSTMVHLYGYTSDEHEQSIWKRIEDMIPNGSSELLLQSTNISDLLKKIVFQSNDKDLRATFVHLFDNSKVCSDLADVVSAIEGINPIIQVIDIQLLLKVYKLMMQFTTTLMNVLAEEAHQESVQSSRAINNQMDELIHRFEESQLPNDQKKQLVHMMEEINRRINDLMK